MARRLPMAEATLEHVCAPGLRVLLFSTLRRDRPCARFRKRRREDRSECKSDLPAGSSATDFRIPAGVSSRLGRRNATTIERIPGMASGRKSPLRRIAASIWTATLIGMVLVALHGWWLVESRHKADVISGFGVSIAVLGIFVAAQPLIRAGIVTTARWQFGLVEEIVSIEEADAAKRVFKERVYGVVLVAIGTLLNGYAPAIARLLGLSV